MPHKYKARPVFGDGHWWDSTGEYRRYQDLRLLERAGKLSNLELKPTLSLILNNVKLCRYTPDFRYLEGEEWIYEDFKGYQTPEFKLKKKLVKALLGIDIRITTAKDLSRTGKRR